MMNMIYALTANGRPFMENAKEAGTVTLLGMAAIFSVLALLWMMIEIMHRLVVRPPKQVEKKVPDASEQKVSAPAAPASAAPAVQNDGALVAAITAAISAAMAEEGYTGGFRVVSFRRIPSRKNRR